MEFFSVLEHDDAQRCRLVSHEKQKCQKVKVEAPAAGESGWDEEDRPNNEAEAPKTRHNTGDVCVIKLELDFKSHLFSFHGYLLFRLM